MAYFSFFAYFHQRFQVLNLEDESEYRFEVNDRKSSLMQQARLKTNE